MKYVWSDEAFHHKKLTGSLLCYYEVDGL